MAPLHSQWVSMSLLSRKWRPGPHASRLLSETRAWMADWFMGAYFQAVFVMAASACVLALRSRQTEEAGRNMV